MSIGPLVPPGAREPGKTESFRAQETAPSGVRQPSDGTTGADALARSGDVAQVSNAARDLVRARQAVDKANVPQSDRLDQLASDVQGGNYQVDVGKLVRRLLPILTGP